MSKSNGNRNSVFLTRYWVGVASREHVLIGKENGFAQFCHGKAGPARRLSKGDWVLYYSSKEKFNESISCNKFTAIGQVVDSAPEQVEQFPGFKPFRRKIQYQNAHEIEIRPILEQLSFIKNKTHWGMVFRYGFFEIPESDFQILSQRMLVTEKQEPKRVSYDSNS